MHEEYFVEEGHADLPGKAWVAYEMGCALGSSTACGSLGALLATEPRVAMDEPRAVALLTQSCDDPESYKREYHCEVFGDVLAKQGKATAAYVYEENCDRKAAASCAKAATLYAEGQLVTQNPARAEALAASACDLGVTTACG